MHNSCGPGGTKYPCCNPYFGKDRRKLNKLTRTRLKEMDIKEQIKDWHSYKIDI